MENKNFLVLLDALANDYKLSRYNVYVNKDKKVVYNTISQAAVAFDDNVIDEADVESLIDLGIVIEKNVDELELLQDEYEKREELVDCFHLIVALTLDCQCRCFYCYEEHPKVYMDDDTKDALVSLIESKAKAGKNISIVWYGGEPLMDFDSLEKLSRIIQRICKDNGVGYHARMITNGYYFDDNIISKVDKLCIRTIQITLDGMKDVHEKRRPVMGDRNSFDRIFNNILRLHRETDTNVRLRINVDKKNIESAYELVVLCAERGLQGIDLTLGMLKEFGCDYNCMGCGKTLFSDKEFSEEFIRFRKYIGDLGFASAYSKMQPEYKVNACTMDSPDAYVIDPYGEVYKCISQVGQTEYSIGNIKTRYSENSHLNVSAFATEQCKQCVYFPICKGGCLNDKQLASNQKCEVWKYITESLVEMDL